MWLYGEGLCVERRRPSGMPTYYVQAKKKNGTGVFKTDTKKGYTTDRKAANVMLATARLQYAKEGYNITVEVMDQDLASLLKPWDFYSMEEALRELDDLMEDRI